MHILKVNDSQTEAAFIRFPVRLYKSSPQWVRPLDEEIKYLFDPARNPFFENGEAGRWILTNFRGQMIGRIAAFYDKKTLADTVYPTGSVGFFECINHQKAAFTLFDVCQEWFARKGMLAMNGPLNLLESTAKWGLLTDGFSEEPLYGMPYHQDYYPLFFEHYGFQKMHKQFNYTADLKENTLGEAFREKAQPVFSDKNYRIEPVSKQHPDTFAQHLCEIYNDAWQSLPYFAPMTLEAAKGIVQRLFPVMDEKMVYFAFYREQPVAFFINLPEMNQVYKHMNGKVNLLGKVKYMLSGEKHKKIVALMMGIKKAHQGKSLEAALAVTLEDYIKSTGGKYQYIEIAGVSESDPKIVHIAQKMQMKVSKVFQTYHYDFPEEAAESGELFAEKVLAKASPS